MADIVKSEASFWPGHRRWLPRVAGPERSPASEAPTSSTGPVQTKGLDGLRRSFASRPGASRRGIETGEAPGWQGATTGNTGLYLREE